MFRVRGIAPALESSRDDIENHHANMNDYGEGRVEDPKEMHGCFGDEDEGAQDADDQIVVRQTIQSALELWDRKDVQ